jgi:hypothetical protein
MSSNDHTADNSEAAAIKVFVAVVLLVIVAAVVLGMTFGMAGIGALAIAASAAMLILCVALTKG